jgi:hypothetical protein
MRAAAPTSLRCAQPQRFARPHRALQRPALAAQMGERVALTGAPAEQTGDSALRKVWEAEQTGDSALQKAWGAGRTGDSGEEEGARRLAAARRLDPDGE